MSAIFWKFENERKKEKVEERKANRFSERLQKTKSQNPQRLKRNSSNRHENFLVSLRLGGSNPILHRDSIVL